MPSEDPFLDSLSDEATAEAAHHLSEVRAGSYDDFNSPSTEPTDPVDATGHRIGTWSVVGALFAAVALGGLIVYIGAGSTHRSGNGGGVAGREYPASVTQWDLMTDQDVLHYHHIRPLIEGGPLDGVPIFNDLRHRLIDFTDEAFLSSHMTTTFLISGHAEYAYLEELVGDCCRILEIRQPPRVFVAGGGELNAYVTGLDPPHILVVTSELLKAYEGHPDELRFIIGHELGHIKCDHVHGHCMAKLLIHLIAGDGKGTLRSEVIAPLLTMDLLHWCRESETSADRAGLICVGVVRGDPDFHRSVAEQALLRLLDRSSVSHDVDTYLNNMASYEQEYDFAAMLNELQSFGQTHPFIPDRIRAIRGWARGAEHATLIERGKLSGTPRRLIVESVSISGLPQTDTDFFGFWDRWAKCDPALVVACGAEIATAPALQDNSDPTYDILNMEFPYYPNSRVVVDIVDSDMSVSNRIGSGVLKIDDEASQVSGRLLIDDAAPESEYGPSVILHYRIID